MHYYAEMQSPLGTITLMAEEDHLLGVWFTTHTSRPDDLGVRNEGLAVIVQAKQQLAEYFSRQRTTFELPLRFYGTEFQEKVWHALQRIPYGEVWSYQQLANAIENPLAVRAVGHANSKNPFSIIVPCHRVIAKNGKLTGYAGGVERKQALLALEANN